MYIAVRVCLAGYSCLLSQFSCFMQFMFVFACVGFGDQDEATSVLLISLCKLVFGVIFFASGAVLQGFRLERRCPHNVFLCPPRGAAYLSVCVVSWVSVPYSHHGVPQRLPLLRWCHESCESYIYRIRQPKITYWHCGGNSGKCLYGPPRFLHGG